MIATQEEYTQWHNKGVAYLKRQTTLTTADCEDVVATVIGRMSLRPRINGNLSAYFFTSCLNGAIDLVRKPMWNNEVMVEPAYIVTAAGENHSAVDEIDAYNGTRSILELIDQLCESQKECMLLRLQGFTVPEISSLTGRSQTSCKRHLWRGRNRLRKLGIADYLPPPSTAEV